MKQAWESNYDKKHTVGRRVLLVFVALVLLLGSQLPTYFGIDRYNHMLIAKATTAAEAQKEITKRQQQHDDSVKEAIAKLQSDAEAKHQASEATKSETLTNPADTIDSTSCNTSISHNDPTKIDVMVNKKHCLQPVTFVPTLVAVDGARLTPEAAAAFDNLYKAAAAAGQGISVTSSYRSYTDQVETYNYWVSVSGKAGADTYSARPGYSEHQTGLALDVAAPGCSLDCFGTTSQYQWMQAHSRDYGFIQRYYAGQESITGYEAEEWHYRYVGVAVAKDMEAKGIKTLEAYWSMNGGDY